MDTDVFAYLLYRQGRTYTIQYFFCVCAAQNQEFSFLCVAVMDASAMPCQNSSSTPTDPLPDKFLSATPFVPSYMRCSNDSDTASAGNHENDILLPTNPQRAECEGGYADGGTSSTVSASAERYNTLLELLPAEVQDILQVNLSHLQATGGGMPETEEARQALRLRAAAATFEQLSIEQMNGVNEAWSTVFGEDEGGVDNDPDSTFTLRDSGLLPEEEEWFMQQIVEEHARNPAPRHREGRRRAPRKGRAAGKGK